MTKFKEVSQLDENKEILTSENEAENTNTDTTAETTENTTFVADEPTESEEMSFAEELVNENAVTAPQPKKKSIIQLPIIIGIVIVAVAAATLFVIKGFFDTSI